MPYRPDIDGLRCIAVMLVVLFHLDFAFMQGGFIGVDVFFVISGYLITRNILKDGDAFSLRTFFARRIRRLMPAAWATIILTAVAAGFLMQPEAAQDAGRSSIAAVFSVSNIFFWMQAGYWDTGAAFKPLLHTWSLAVEEQFYLFWPLLLIFVRRWAVGWRMFALFVALALVGTGVSEWMVQRAPSTAFFWMPFRVHEFAIGALLAVVPAGLRRELPPWLKEVAVLLGLMLIVASGIVMSEATPAPGLWALPGCIGAALIIAIRSQYASRALLENPVSLYLGRISYSLYLVHWPIVSLYKYRTLSELGLAEQVLLGVAMLVAAALLHHLIEAPLRHRKPARPVVGFATAALIAVAVPMAMIQATTLASSAHADHATQGKPLDISREEFLEERSAPPRACRPDCEDPQPDRFNILIIGDSHGPDAFNLLAQVYPEAHLMPAWRASCLMIVGLRQWYQTAPNNYDEDTRRACIRVSETLYADTERLTAADLIVFNHMSNVLPEPLDATLAHLRTVTGAPILVFGNTPVFTQHLRDIAHVAKLAPGDTVPEEWVSRWVWNTDAPLEQVAQKHGAAFVSKLDHFCPQRQCRAFTADGTRLITYDGHHLSLAAAQEFGRAQAEAIRRAVEASTPDDAQSP